MFEECEMCVKRVLRGCLSGVQSVFRGYVRGVLSMGM